MPSRTKSAAIARPTFGRSSSTVTSTRRSFFFTGSPSFPAADQADRDAFDHEALPRIDLDRREVGILRHEQHVAPAALQAFDRDFVAESRDDHLAGARVGR